MLSLGLQKIKMLFINVVILIHVPIKVLFLLQQFLVNVFLKISILFVILIDVNLSIANLLIANLIDHQLKNVHF